MSMKLTKTTKEQESKPQTISNQWFKGKSKETLTQLDSDLNNKEAESIEILDSNLSTRLNMN
ncbi:24881_t:CDS:1, partial [Gigaspora margarita]